MEKIIASYLGKLKRGTVSYNDLPEEVYSNMDFILNHVRRLKLGTLSYTDIPEKITSLKAFIRAERENGYRLVMKKGFDIITNSFFVYERVKVKDEKHSFDNFDDYYSYLDGDIYYYASYYQYSFGNDIIDKYQLDVNKLRSCTHFTEYKHNDLKIKEIMKEDFSNEATLYNERESNKKNVLKWIEKFSVCKTIKDFNAVKTNFRKLDYPYQIYYVVLNIAIRNNPTTIFKALIKEYNTYTSLYTLDPLWGHYSSEQILNAVKFDVDKYYGSKQSFYKQRKQFQNAIAKINSTPQKSVIKKGFDDYTHFYYVKTTHYYAEYDSPVIIDNFFATFDEFISFLDNDLSDCDLSAARLQNIDFGQYSTNENTLFPRSIIDYNKISEADFVYTIEKEFLNGLFCVVQKWEGLGLSKIKKRTFEHFCDFVYYLDGDLSNANLSLCPGLINLNSIDELNLKDAKLQSIFCDKFGLTYNKIVLPSTMDYSFPNIIQNEEKTKIVLQNKNELVLSGIERLDYQKISYISDIHLLHLFENNNCRCESDCDYVINNIITSFSDYGDYLLIGGDISSDFSFYERFVTSLSNNFSRKKIIFILGNHELWPFSGIPINEITQKYNQTIRDAGFYFLQNSLLFETIDSEVKEINEETLFSLSADELKDVLSKARLVIFGGLAFSGLNEEFNANNGIYRNVISRQQEIAESHKFELLYDKVRFASQGKNTIILTHTKKEDWTSSNYDSDFIYVNGHTHFNYFCDDEQERVYADNQIGYGSKNTYLKYFYINKDYDYFSSYADNIYKITKEQYIDFYRAKNLQLNFNREGTIYMLKRNGYYCFLFEGKKSLSMLNGGQLKSLVIKDINYYYERMPEVINTIKEPLNKFYEVQNLIAEQIKLIGGYGRIHGAIIDIDFYNHIYVNPHDLTITGYFAYDIIRKYVYQNIPSLLKVRCPKLYKNYVKKIEGTANNALVVPDNTKIVTDSKFYSKTDIYKASRIIRKMQKVNHGILSTWVETQDTPYLPVDIR